MKKNYLCLMTTIFFFCLLINNLWAMNVSPQDVSGLAGETIIIPFSVSDVGDGFEMDALGLTIQADPNSLSFVKVIKENSLTETFGLFHGMQVENGIKVNASLLGNPINVTADDILFYAQYIVLEDAGNSSISLINFKDDISSAETSSANFTLKLPDRAPVVNQAIDDVTINEDIKDHTIDLSNVFTDPDNDDISISIISNDNESLIILSIENNLLTLEAVENKSGQANISIQGSANGKNATDSFVVTVTPVNDPPTASNDQLVTVQDQALSANLTGQDIDNDTLTFQISSQPTKGTLTLENSQTGAFNYVPNANTTGMDSFEFIVSDGQLNSSPAAISIQIKELVLTQPIKCSIPENIQAITKQKIDFPISFSNANSEKIEAYDLYLSYDQSKLSVSEESISFKNSIFNNENYEVVIFLNSPGEIYLGLYATGKELVKTEGLIANIQVDVIGNSGDTTSIQLEESYINNYTIDPMNSDISISGHSISGRAVYYKNVSDNPLVVKPIPGVKMILSNETQSFTTLTDENGYYTFSGMAPGEYFIAAEKDTDLGGLDSIDSSRASRFAGRVIDLTALERLAGDVDMSGRVLSMDASRIARYNVGLISQLNDNNLHWLFITQDVSDCIGRRSPDSYETTYQITLNENTSNLDIIGMRLGDISGSWTVDTPQKRSRRTPLRPETQILSEQNDTISIPIVINSTELVEGLFVQIKYDAKKLRPNRNYLLDSRLDSFQYSKVVNDRLEGVIKISIFAEADIATIVNDILTVEFDVIQEGRSFIQLENIKCNNHNISGGFSVNDQVVSSVEIVTEMAAE